MGQRARPTLTKEAAEEAAASREGYRGGRMSGGGLEGWRVGRSRAGRARRVRERHETVRV